jgi:pyrroline-5-carboxylate reductase
MKTVVIGYGNMGKIYARSLVKHGLSFPEEVFLVRRNTSSIQSKFRSIAFSDPLFAEAEMILLCVKPQDYPALADDLQKNIQREQILVSVMAGITIERLVKDLKHSIVFRAMPNAPIDLGMGMTGFCASSEVTMDQVRKVEQVLSTTGRTIFFSDEEKMDAVTALSGSGPAYFYYIVNAMVKAGIEIGLNDHQSRMMVKQTMLGAFHLLNGSDQEIDELIATVASKGGTTEAALRVFKQGRLDETIIDGIKSARARGKELSQSSL